MLHDEFWSGCPTMQPTGRCILANQVGVPMLAHLGRHVGRGPLCLQLHQALRDSLGALLAGHQLLQGAQHLHKPLPLQGQAHQAGDGLHAGSPAATAGTTVRPVPVPLLHHRQHDSAHSTKPCAHPAGVQCSGHATCALPVCVAATGQGCSCQACTAACTVTASEWRP